MAEALTGQITDPTGIARLGTILSIWAHPDDESFLAGGIMATAVSQGQTVICVTATKGEGGSQDAIRWPPETMPEVRTSELTQALRILGVKKHYWLDYQDGCCADASPHQAADKLLQIINKEKPDSIITFGSDGWTGHTDHCTVSKWTDEAVERLGADIAIYHAVDTPEQYEDYLKPVDKRLNLFFNIDKPPLVQSKSCAIYFVVPPAMLKLKRQALAAMPSQTEMLFKSFDQPFLDQVFAIEAFVRNEQKPKDYLQPLSR